MKDLLLKKMLYLLGEQINDNDYDILVYAVEHIETLHHISIREMASINFVSTSAISRLCKKLGFGGYSQFRFELIAIHKELQQQTIKKGNGNVDKAYHDSLSKLSNNLSTSLSELEETGVYSAINLLKNAKTIITMGLGYSDIMAQYFTYRMMMCDIFTQKIEVNAPGGIYNRILRDTDLLVIFSRSGESNGFDNKVSLAKNNHIPILLFTSERSSKYAQLATCVLHLKGIPKTQDFSNMVTGYHVNTIALIDILSSLII